MQKTFNIKIKGMHCRGCKVLIEEELGGIKGLQKVEVDLKNEEAVVEIKNEESRAEIFKAIERLGYSAKEFTKDFSGRQKEKKSDKKKTLVFALVLLILFFFGYYLFQYLGVFETLSALNEENVSYFLIFLIGLLASFHCVGMCGGLVVSYTIVGGKKDQEKKSSSKHFNYNAGRVVSYTLIGAILGGFGSFFGINPSFSGFVLLLAGAAMLVMGLSILSEFRWIKKIKAKILFSEKPGGVWSFCGKIAENLYKNKKRSKVKGPFLVGLLTGFMPCGPLQAMQLYALISGSISQGALVMLLYSIGTIPLMFGFGSIISALKKTRIKQIIKISGLVIVFLGFLMINRGLVNFGFGFSSILPSGANPEIDSQEKNSENIQIVEMDVSYSGYKPNVIYIEKDIPVRWIIKDKGITGCTNEIFLFHENGTIKKKLNQKETIIEFVPTKLGELKFSCWMKMVWGKFVVAERENAEAGILQSEKINMPISQTSACGGSCGEACGASTEQKGCACGLK